jgi:hypothetical protein
MRANAFGESLLHIDTNSATDSDAALQDVDASERALFTQGTVKASRDKKISFDNHHDKEGDDMEPEDLSLDGHGVSIPSAPPLIDNIQGPSLNPNLKAKANPSSPSGIAPPGISVSLSSKVSETLPVSFRSFSRALADEDDDDEDKEWGASKTEYSVADLSIEQGMEHLTTSDYLPPRVSPGGSSIMSSRSKNNSTTSPTVTAQPVPVAAQPPLFAKRSTVSDDEATKEDTQLPSLNSKGTDSKGLSKASTGPLTKARSSRISGGGDSPTSKGRSSNSGFVPMKIDWSKTSDTSLASLGGEVDFLTRLTDSENASPVPKAQTLERKSSNAPSPLARPGSSTLLTSGASPTTKRGSDSGGIPKALTIERRSSNALSPTARPGSSTLSTDRAAPNAKRGSDGFVPMKIDWSKTSDTSLASLGGEAGTSTRISNSGNASPVPKAQTLERKSSNAPSPLARPGSSTLLTSGASPTTKRGSDSGGIPKALTIERRSSNALSPTARPGSSTLSTNRAAPNAKRGTDGFVPMKIDWSKTPDISLNSVK